MARLIQRHPGIDVALTKAFLRSPTMTVFSSASNPSSPSGSQHGLHGSSTTSGTFTNPAFL